LLLRCRWRAGARWAGARGGPGHPPMEVLELAYLWFATLTSLAAAAWVAQRKLFATAVVEAGTGGAAARAGLLRPPPPLQQGRRTTPANRPSSASRPAHNAGDETARATATTPDRPRGVDVHGAAYTTPLADNWLDEEDEVDEQEQGDRLSSEPSSSAAGWRRSPGSDGAPRTPTRSNQVGGRGAREARSSAGPPPSSAAKSVTFADVDDDDEYEAPPSEQMRGWFGGAGGDSGGDSGAWGSASDQDTDVAAAQAEQADELLLRVVRGGCATRLVAVPPQRAAAAVATRCAC
jgi:hypothetical protein